MESVVTEAGMLPAERAIPSIEFWRGKRVFLTGHTGFKGAWLTLWLSSMGAQVCGYSLAPEGDPNMFSKLGLKNSCDSLVGDVRDLQKLKGEISRFDPEIIFHLAAQPLVRLSYGIPVETFDTNVMGTVNLMESCRNIANLRAVICITTDKVYENKEWFWAYRETEPLGGHDPYSASKACAEIVVSAFRNSFFASGNNTLVATTRAGNIVGGGDWSVDRLLPDCVRAITAGQELEIRHPGAIRPWQHVIEPLCGYLLLAEQLFGGRVACATAFNFGPPMGDLVPVKAIVELADQCWEGLLNTVYPEVASSIREAQYLALDSTRSRMMLGWRQILNARAAVKLSIEWYKLFYTGSEAEYLVQLTLNQIEEYVNFKQGNALCGNQD